MKMSDLAGISEIFASIQGEGLFCGSRQIFIRFIGCNLSCAFCDTPDTSRDADMPCRAQISSENTEFEIMPNPLSVEDVVNVCLRLDAKSISITGGEPLLNADFLVPLFAALKNSGFCTHLETNGTLYNELEKVIDITDVIAMDIKLPSSSGIDNLWQAHSKFLEIASKKQVFVKAVVSADTSMQEIQQCSDIIAGVNKDIPFIIQPVTSEKSVCADYLIALQLAALKKLSDVRVIPQCHKILGAI